MGMADNDHYRNFTSWLRFWTTPLGVFVVVVTLAFAAQVYNSLRFQDEIQERRMEFCQAENREATRVRVFWKGIIKQSQANPALTKALEDFLRDLAIATGVPFPEAVTQREVNTAGLARFDRLLADVYPLRDCKEF